MMESQQPGLPLLNLQPDQQQNLPGQQLLGQPGHLLQDQQLYHQRPVLQVNIESLSGLRPLKSVAFQAINSNYFISRVL